MRIYDLLVRMLPIVSPNSVAHCTHEITLLDFSGHQLSLSHDQMANVMILGRWIAMIEVHATRREAQATIHTWFSLLLLKVFALLSV